MSQTEEEEEEEREEEEREEEEREEEEREEEDLHSIIGTLIVTAKISTRLYSWLFIDPSEHQI